jgi:hypothetical protein
MVLAMLAVLVVPPLSAFAEGGVGTGQFKHIPISGYGENGETFEGFLNIKSLEVMGGGLWAIGDVTGKLTDMNGKTRGVHQKDVAFPVTSPSFGGLSAVVAQQQGGTCTILDLTLGPIDLFLLGIRITTNEIRITITAQENTLLGGLLRGIFF